MLHCCYVPSERPTSLVGFSHGFPHISSRSLLLHYTFGSPSCWSVLRLRLLFLRTVVLRNFIEVVFHQRRHCILMLHVAWLWAICALSIAGQKVVKHVHGCLNMHVQNMILHVRLYMYTCACFDVTYIYIYILMQIYMFLTLLVIFLELNMNKGRCNVDRWKVFSNFIEAWHKWGPWLPWQILGLPEGISPEIPMKFSDVPMKPPGTLPVILFARG